MSYLDIENLYKTQDILLFKECFALEKIHGTSAHVRFSACENVFCVRENAKVAFFSGGEKHDRFAALFDQNALLKAFSDIFGPAMRDGMIVYGEAYGGSQQGMSGTYGKALKFIAFDVMVGGKWLAVPQAEDVVKKLGLEFVHYVRISTDLAAIDAERDADSAQAVRNGVGTGKKREGVVLRPVIEVIKNNGARVIAKHKADAFSEHARPPRVIDPAQLEVLKNAEAIAEQWATEMRLTHVLQELPDATGMEHTAAVIKAMIADVYKEGNGEVVESKAASTAIGKKTAEMWKKRVRRFSEGADHT